MKKSANTNLSRQDLQNIGHLMEAKNVAQTREIYDRLAHTEKKLENRIEKVEKDVAKIKKDASEIKDELGQVKTAVLELSDTDAHLHNLTRKLRQQGLSLEDKKIFAV